LRQAPAAFVPESGASFLLPGPNVPMGNFLPPPSAYFDNTLLV